jgi:hypothetical protein
VSALHATELAACTKAYEGGQRSRNAGQLLEAREALRICSDPKCPTVVTRDCVEWLAELERSLPTVIVRVRSASGADVADATVQVDGLVVANRTEGRPIALDPGAHTIRVEADGLSAETKVVAVVTEKDRIVTIVLPARQPTPKADEPPPAAGPSGLRGPPTTATIAFAFGGVALFGAGVLYVRGRGRLAELRETCAPACDQASVDGARDTLRLGDVALGVGIVAGALGTILWITDRPAVVPNVAVGPGGASLGVTGRF